VDKILQSGKMQECEPLFGMMNLTKRNLSKGETSNDRINPSSPINAADLELLKQFGLNANVQQAEKINSISIKVVSSAMRLMDK